MILPYLGIEQVKHFLNYAGRLTDTSMQKSQFASKTKNGLILWLTMTKVQAFLVNNVLLFFPMNFLEVINTLF